MADPTPQVFEPILDQILAGTETSPSTLAGMLRALLVVRRRYNDPLRTAGKTFGITGQGPSYESVDIVDGPASDTAPGRLGGVPFSTAWTITSQKARVEAGIAFLTPLVGAVVGAYPPIAVDTRGVASTDTTKTRFDAMGNMIPPGMP